MVNDSTSNWMSVSDMMSGLMMVFLFIAVVYMNKINEEKKSVETIALTYQEYQDDLYQSLKEEFSDDLVRWDASILPDGTFRFHEPEVLFDQGSTAIKDKFQMVLAEFFPRYIALLSNERYRSNIEEVRIEGHTSSSWNGSAKLKERYLKNAQLSQERSFVILDYCFGLPTVVTKREWLTKVLRANGLAFAQPILQNGKEDELRSRRVEFKVRTKADEQIRKIIESFGNKTVTIS